MSVRRLPAKANLEHLRNESRDLQRLVRAGDDEAIADLRAHHGKKAAAAASLSLTDAQHVVARRYGFPSWKRLRDHVEQVTRLSRLPTAEGDDEDLASRFLRLACLTYGGDDRRRPVEAREMLDAHPEVGRSSIHAAAAAGDVDAARSLLAIEPSAVHEEGGPHRWVPLLYAAYSRVDPSGGRRSTLEVARLLLAAGADPNAGYLWDSVYPFTVLTGVFGGGEDWANQPEHAEASAFARLVLEAGADPNDTQTLYNRMFRPATDHLELLFEFGLGRTPMGAWAERQGPGAMPIGDALGMDLQWAAEHDFRDKVRLLLDRGVDPDSECGHPTFGGRRPLELAERNGNDGIVDQLLAAGAQPATLDSSSRLVAACLRGDRAGAKAVIDGDPDVVAAAEEHSPLHRAARLRRPRAAELMVEIGFDVNLLGRTTPLHDAAASGDLEMVQTLVRLGADPTVRDRAFDATPLGWAEHEGHEAVVAFLRALTP